MTKAEAKKRRHARYAHRFAESELGTADSSPMYGVSETLRLFGLEPGRRRDKFNTWSAKNPKFVGGLKGLDTSHKETSGYGPPLPHELRSKTLVCEGIKGLVLGSGRGRKAVRIEKRSEQERMLMDLRRTPAERRKLRVY